MDRRQAVEVIKEIFERCGEMEGKSLTLLPPRNNDALSDTFQVHIRTDSEQLKSCVEAVTRERRLGVCQEGDFLVVYKPHDEFEGNGVVCKR